MFDSDFTRGKYLRYHCGSPSSIDVQFPNESIRYKDLYINSLFELPRQRLCEHG